MFLLPLPMKELKGRGANADVVEMEPTPNEDGPARVPKRIGSCTELLMGGLGGLGLGGPDCVLRPEPVPIRFLGEGVFLPLRSDKKGLDCKAGAQG